MMNHEISSSVGNVEFRGIRGIRGFLGGVAMLLALVCGLLPLSPARGAILDIFGNVLDTRDPAPGVDYSGVRWDNADLRGLDLTGVSFRLAFLTNAHFQNAIIHDVDFFNASARDSNFEGASLKNTLRSGEFIRSSFRKVDFRQAGVDALGGRISDNHFKESDFFMANFAGTNIASGSFQDVDLTYADFTNAIIDLGVSGDASNANFQNAIFLETSIYGLTVAGADFRGASGELRFDRSIGNEQFTGSFYDDRTALVDFDLQPLNYEQLGFIYVPEPGMAVCLIAFGLTCFARIRRNRIR